MNKYQEALKEITHLTFVETKYYEMLKKLVEEKDEQESRKDKLVVGSEWECVVDCLGERKFNNGDTHTMIIRKEQGIEVVKTHYISTTYGFVNSSSSMTFTMPTDQFLLCFKPR